MVFSHPESAKLRRNLEVHLERKIQVKCISLNVCSHLLMLVKIFSLLRKLSGLIILFILLIKTKHDLINYILVVLND